MATESSQSRIAFHELIDLLKEVDQRFLSPEWGINGAPDVATGMRAVLHLLQGGLFTHFEEDPAHPHFRRIVSPTRKFTGDNADAIYYDTPINPNLTYRVRGGMAGAVYMSLTVEAGTAEGAMGTHTAGVLNDESIDVSQDGSFEVTLGGPAQARNWLALPTDASRITTRHYFENTTPAAADQNIQVPLSIETIETMPPPPCPDDASVAAGIQRIMNFVRSRTLEMPPPGQGEQPPFVSATPNEFPRPIKPGDFGLAAADAAYSMAPYVIGPDQALILTGRWPDCRCANVSLWNRHMQTYDFSNRSVSLNRRQTQAEPDGRFRMVLAHQDPGVPNWLDTEGRPFGLVFWRFMLPEGSIEPITSQVVPFEECQG